jgi:hypothetical protein
LDYRKTLNSSTLLPSTIEARRRLTHDLNSCAPKNTVQRWFLTMFPSSISTLLSPFSLTSVSWFGTELYVDPSNVSHHSSIVCCRRVRVQLWRPQTSFALVRTRVGVGECVPESLRPRRSIFSIHSCPSCPTSLGLHAHQKLRRPMETCLAPSVADAATPHASGR